VFHVLLNSFSKIAFYGLGLNSGTILNAIGYGTPLTSGTQKVYDNLMNIATGNTILAVAGLILGYYATFFLVDVVGRKPIQLMGFSILTVLFIIMGKYLKVDVVDSDLIPGL
jgi:PHS family inorganic phosphate transporter-like MFS transporter